MGKINSILFDQDYSARGIISRGTIGAGVGIFTTAFFNDLEFGPKKFTILGIGFLVFLLGAFLVKTKKKNTFDERIFTVQLKSYTYSWNAGIFSLFFGGYFLDSKNAINISNPDFATSVIAIMCLVYFISYAFLKNKE